MTIFYDDLNVELCSPESACYALYERCTDVEPDQSYKSKFLLHVYGYDNAIKVMEGLANQYKTTTFPPFQPHADIKNPSGEGFRVRQLWEIEAAEVWRKENGFKPEYNLKDIL